ncbi:MAG: tetratricopeptide repeat protein [Desulfobacterales bacterium]|nr:MAG: tetratricopeptide repeat protein [Desulfobacterales bacterium]
MTVATPFLLSKVAAANPSILSQATEYFRSGRYSEALSLFQRTDGADLIPGVIGAARTWMMTGQYSEAEAICRKTLVQRPGEMRLISQLAEILALTGRSDQALEILEPVVYNSTPSPRCLVQYGELLRMRGRRDEAAGVFQRAISQYNNGRIIDSEGLAMVGVASRYLERFHDANRLFREALRTDTENLEAQVLWGDLFREKYNDAEAGKSYSDVLQRNERHVPALLGMAATLGGRAAQKILETALEINARSESALEALAEMAIEDDRMDAAEAYLARILETNRESVNARTLLAAIAYLRDKTGEYEDIRRALAQFSPGNGRFYARIAEICGRKYRFEEAVEMARLAVMTDPDHWNAYTVLGMNLLRLGRENEGRAYLEQAFESDPFNFWTMNMLRVLDLLDGFETRRNAHFIVRMHPSDADTLWPYLNPLLEESWQTLTAKYEFVPQGPILVEVFQDHEDFAVRTSGLPYIGPIVGVCFGGVITLDSPSALKPPRSMNWQEIVWHEFTHVITLQMARNRLPRWLSEGISVYEEKSGRPEWGRRQDLELVKAVQDDRILPIRTLNEGFSKAESTQDLSFAYYQSSLVVEYIAERYGLQSLKNLVFQHRSPKDMEVIFMDVFHASLASFETGFRAWLNERVQRINVYVHPDLPGARGMKSEDETKILPLPSIPQASEIEALAEALRQRIALQPRDFQAHFQLGMMLYKNEEYEDAIRHLEIARDLLPEYGGDPNPRQILADLYAVQGDETAMLRELEALVKYQQHAFDACYKLARAYQERDDYAKVVYFLERAIAVDPYHPDVHKLLARAAFEKADYEKAIREYKILTTLDDTDPVNAHTDLAHAYLSGGKKEEAKKSALLALEIAPTFERAQNILLDSLEPEMISR